MRHEWDHLPQESTAERFTRFAAELNDAFAGAEAVAVLEQAMAQMGHKLALVSSFGAESVVLLHMVSQIDRHQPVLMLDTQLLFRETLQYQTDVSDRLGLTNVQRLSTDPVLLRLADAENDLNRRAPEDCCHLRKTAPLQSALVAFDGWITGRKRHQTAARANIEFFEASGSQMKINPLAHWAPGQAAKYILDHNLPQHPLFAKGYASIGCAPCTAPVKAGEDPRAGRWRGQDKTECGIHLDLATGRMVRSTKEMAS